MTLTLDRVSLDVATRKIVETSVSSDVFAGARVPYDDLTKEDRAWLASLIHRAAVAWLGREPDGVVSFVDGRLSGDTGAATADANECERLLAMFLDAVSGTLLIDPNARGLTKRSGDSPA